MLKACRNVIITLALLCGALPAQAQFVQPGNFSIGRCDVRLTLTTGTPVTTADVTAATSVFVTPTAGGQCAFYDGSGGWQLVAGLAEVTVSVPATTSQMYDVFCFYNAGAMGCDAAVAWTNDTTRATALVNQNGVPSKTGTLTRRYVGSFRTTTVSGQTEDSATKRYVWNYYNRVRRSLARLETTASWTYNIATYRQANASTSNQVDVIVGVAEVPINLQVSASASNNNAGTIMMVSIGEDSTTTPSPSALQPQVQASANNGMALFSVLIKYPAVGRHFYAWLEIVSVAAATSTFVGTTGTGSPQSGIVGFYEG
jgi:hypothetical protein